MDEVDLGWIPRESAKHLRTLVVAEIVRLSEADTVDGQLFTSMARVLADLQNAIRGES